MVTFHSNQNPKTIGLRRIAPSIVSKVEENVNTQVMYEQQHLLGVEHHALVMFCPPQHLVFWSSGSSSMMFPEPGEG